VKGEGCGLLFRLSSENSTAKETIGVELNHALCLCL